MNFQFAKLKWRRVDYTLKDIISKMKNISNFSLIKLKNCSIVLTEMLKKFTNDKNVFNRMKVKYKIETGANLRHWISIEIDLVLQ